MLPIAPSTYYDHKTKQCETDKRSSRAKRDELLINDIQRVWEENYRVYSVRKIWRQLKREDIKIACCTYQAAVRALAFKWIHILYRCWITRTSYDEAKYLKALKDRGPSLLQAQTA